MSPVQGSGSLAWFGRAVVWAGTILLVAMAVMGRQQAEVTVLTVLGVMVGLFVLAAGIVPKRDPSPDPSVSSQGDGDE